MRTPELIRRASLIEPWMDRTAAVPIIGWRELPCGAFAPTYADRVRGAASVKEAAPASGSYTITLNSLASSGTVGRQSTVVDETTNLYLTAQASVQISAPNLAAANDKALYVYGFATVDGGTTYPEGLGAADASYTIQGAAGALTTALRVIGVIPFVQNVTAWYGPFDVSVITAGMLGLKHGIIVLNYGGQTLNGTNNSAKYQEFYATVA